MARLWNGWRKSATLTMRLDVYRNAQHDPANCRDVDHGQCAGLSNEWTGSPGHTKPSVKLADGKNRGPTTP